MKKIFLRLVLVMAVVWFGACEGLEQLTKKDTAPPPAKTDKDAVKPKADKPAAEKPAPNEPTSDKPAAGSGNAVNIFYKGQTLTVTHSGSRWELKDGGKTYAVESTGGYAFKYFEDGNEITNGGFKEDKLKFKSADGGLWLKMKFKNEDGVEKIKISLTDDDPQPWSLKIKEDKVKVEKGELDIGKVKYYPDNGKVKVKDAADKEVASTKDLDNFKASMGVFLMDGLDQSRKNCVMLTLFALGK